MITRRNLFKLAGALLTKALLPKILAPSDTWHHAAGAFNSNDSRIYYLDGKVSGVHVFDKALSIDEMAACASGASPLTRMLWENSELAVWEAILTDKEIDLLYSGMSPQFIRPESLVYWTSPVPSI